MGLRPTFIHPMIYLLISILFMSLANLSQRYSGLAGANAYGVNAVSRLISGVAAIVAIVTAIGVDPILHTSPPVLLWAGIGGFFYWLSGLAAIKAYSLGHLGISSTILRCSMIVPTAASLIFWHEIVFALDSVVMWAVLLSLVLMLIAIVFSGMDQIRASTKRNEPFSSVWAIWIILAFICQGGWEITLRASGSFASEQERQVYLALVFIIALVLSLGTLVVVRFMPRKKEILFGVGLGLLAMLGTSFRPAAIRDLSGVIVFPMTALGTMVLLNILSRLIWKTHLGRWGAAGLAAAVFASLLLCYR